MLRFPRVLWAVGLLSVLLALPSLFADFYADDQAMVLTIEGVAPAPIPGPFHLYSFMTGAPGERDWLVQQSALPWWSVDGIRLSFFRPLSSALWVLDHALAGRHPLLYHVHSIAWYLLSVLAAALLFRRLLPERQAALAALLFAVSPAHWMLVAWPSARHVAISGALAFIALLLHLEAREQSGRRSRWLSLTALGCAALALCGGETALGLFGYIAAYEMTARRERLALRLRALAPWGALLLAYAAIYKGFGFGVRGAGGYVDPMAQTSTYLALLPTRLAIYLEASLLCIPSELSMVAPKFGTILAILGVVAGLAFTPLLRRAMRAVDAELRRTLVWLLIGAFLAVLPGAASMPGDRVLFLSNLGVSAALSVVFLHAGRSPKPAIASGLARTGSALFGLVHGLLAPVLFAFGAWQLASSSHAALEAAAKAEIPVRPGVMVAGIGLADPLVGMYLPASLFIAPRPEPRPVAVQLLSTSAHDHRLRRTGDRSLEITVLDGALLEGALESLFRPPSAPLHVGDRLPLGGWTVQILEESAGRPKRFSVSFDRSLDDPTISLLIWKDGALRSLAAPRLGEQAIVKHELGPMGL
ncbi:MAG TPA: hypothetical protein VJV79_25555 [Polyangiaceae bacterium]|nr:hypothetical protein [Polyangiaceae bacterium]